MNRISVVLENDDNASADPAASTSSDPAGGGSSSVTSSSDPAAVTLNNSDRGGRDDADRGSSRGGEGSNNISTTGGAAMNNSGDANPSPSSNSTHPVRESSSAAEEELEQRLADLRAILPDASDEELRQILGENDRASNNTQQSRADAATATATQAAVSSSSNNNTSPTSRPSAGNSRGQGSARASRTSSSRSRRSWQPCQQPPSRPGVFSVGGPVTRGGSYNVGTTDLLQLEIKRIEAVSQVQEALNEKLGYNLMESGKYEEMARQYKEGERMLAMTGLERREKEKKVVPTMMVWDAPPFSRKSLMKKEPTLPPPGKPLPLPLSFGGQEEMTNRELVVGKFVDTAPDEDEDEQKREECTIDNESTWAEVSVDDSPMGPYDQVVRCWKCRAGLRVHIEVGLVACPRCRSISPATELANIG